MKVAPILDRPSDHIWGLVCGFLEPQRSNQNLLMLKAFVDDSDVGLGPVFTLGGFMGSAHKWAPFADAWADILWMKPRVDYFKFSEAMGLSGQFSGFSEQSRNEKLSLLINLIEEYELIGISSHIQKEIFDGWFGMHKDMFGNPYAILFYGIMIAVFKYCKSNNISEKLDFIFDDQPGQMDKVLRGWNDFKSQTPPEYAEYIGDPPIFRNDKTTIPLQAADLSVGAWRMRANSVVKNRPYQEAPWGDRGSKVLRIYSYIDWRYAQETFIKKFGFRPITYSSGDVNAPRYPFWPPKFAGYF